MDNWCNICLSEIDLNTGICSNPECPNSIPNPEAISPLPLEEI